MKKRIYLYDTTLRDGAQTAGISFSVAEKRAISQDIYNFGIDYIEAGWPGANPTDTELFANLSEGNIVSFGMTQQDTSKLDTLIGPKNAVCLFGKTWDFQVETALGISLDQNLEMITASFEYLKNSPDNRKIRNEFIFDAEHFFDGYKSNPKYALKCLFAAISGGANWIVLCDTNGGTLPHEVTDIVEYVYYEIDGYMNTHIGIHCHDDTGNAVANSLAAVRAGATMVQGTLNGLGERCGNANLVTLIPILELKMGYTTGVDNLAGLTDFSRKFDKYIHKASNQQAPFVGKNAFAHKGGVHASAVAKDSKCYEHIDPALVGNTREILISDQMGRANIIARIQDLNISLDSDQALSLVEKIKTRDTQGYLYDEADASFELLVARELNMLPDYFQLGDTELTISVKSEGKTKVHVLTQVLVNNVWLYPEAESTSGPVHAIDMAIRSILEEAFPSLKYVTLEDFRVQTVNSNHGTDAITRVVVKHSNGTKTWCSCGVSSNVIGAAIQALQDAFIFSLYKEVT